MPKRWDCRSANKSSHIFAGRTNLRRLPCPKKQSWSIGKSGRRVRPPRDRERCRRAGHGGGIRILGPHSRPGERRSQKKSSLGVLFYKIVVDGFSSASQRDVRRRLVLRGQWIGLTGGKTNPDRKSTRLNSSHVAISYAVFCLKKK